MRAYGVLMRSAVQLQRRSPSAQRLPCLVLTVAKPVAASKPLQRRAFATSTSADDADGSQQLVYEAPMARAVRLMKGVSLTSCFLTSVGMPVLCYVSEQSASVIGKWAMCGTIMLFGLGTTSLYHVLFKPYVLRMWVVGPSTPLRDDTVVSAETLTLLAQRTTQQFKLGDVTRPVNSMHPMVSFSVRDKNYYIHPEVLADNELVKKFMGDDFQVIKKPETNAQQEEDYY